MNYDMLVKLYELPELEPEEKALARQGIDLRAAKAYEKNKLIPCVKAHFGEGWASECEVSFSRQPIACVIAVRAGEVLGFACYDVTARGFFGPIGILESARGTGLGRALLLSALHALKHMDYAYAVIGGPEEKIADFY